MSLKPAADFHVNRYHIDLTSRVVRYERLRCTDLEDVLGGAARAYKILEDRPVEDPYDPNAALILNLGLLSGTNHMTGLRTYFHAYSPLKRSKGDAPGAMWTAGSGKFGTKLRAMEVDEVVFTGRLERPGVLHVTPMPEGAHAEGTASFRFLEGEDLRGQRTNDKIQDLHKRFPGAHFAVIGPAGENYENNRLAAIGLSTGNELKSGDPKPRWCGRGGIGGVMGSKNLLAIVADGPDPKGPRPPARLKDINMEIARGKGSARFREKSDDGGGGTWANVEALDPVGAMPEFNFVPTGNKDADVLYRDYVEEKDGRWIVKAEACFRCGVRCHKNVYDKNPDGPAGRFRGKLDFEPLVLLSCNIGIYDLDECCTLVELVDEMGMDSISCGVTLSFAMEHNKRHPGNPVAGGLSYGDFEGTMQAIIDMGYGRLPDLGNGTKKLAEKLGGDAGDYAMQCKGMELPAYLPQSNPGYPFALAGGHMSMQTYLLLLYERETSMEYWVDAITNRGWAIMRDDMLGVCKFSKLDDAMMAESIGLLTGLQISADELAKTTLRTYLRGYRIERRQGFTDDDYDLPADSHKEYPQIDLPHFNTPAFFSELKGKVLARFAEMASEEGLPL